MPTRHERVINRKLWIHVQLGGTPNSNTTWRTNSQAVLGSLPTGFSLNANELSIPEEFTVMRLRGTVSGEANNTADGINLLKIAGDFGPFEDLVVSAFAVSQDKDGVQELDIKAMRHCPNGDRDWETA